MDDHANGFSAGVRSCIAWLSKRANGMNDPHAKAVLNSAAFSLGASKPIFAHPLPQGRPGRDALSAADQAAIERVRKHASELESWSIKGGTAEFRGKNAGDAATAIRTILALFTSAPITADAGKGG